MLTNNHGSSPSLAKKVLAGVVATAAVCLLVGYTGTEMMRGDASHKTASVQSFDTLGGTTCGGVDAQCGGIGFTGGKCCVAGYTCKYSNKWWSQCIEDQTLTGCNFNWDQCGGTSYTGSKPGVCCGADFTCYAENQEYSQCRPTGQSFPPFTYSPTFAPTSTPTVAAPTDAPTLAPTLTPTNQPTGAVTPSPTAAPTVAGCVVNWGQCGGQNYTGTGKCCDSGYACSAQSIWYSQCRPINDGFPPFTTPTPTPTAAYTPGTCVAEWEQCGGKNNDGTAWAGPTTCCVPGYSCFKQDDWYSQCRTGPF